MPARRKKPARDPRETEKIEELLKAHFPDHPSQYPPKAYRYNPASIRVRVVSRRFKKLDRVQRNDLVFPLLEENLPKDTWLDVMNILLLAPDEVADSFANREFERPSPSEL